METYEIIAQAIGIAAMAINILSYQAKKQRTVIAMMLVGCSLFAINFWMLGATVGAILNIISAIRSVVFLFKDKLKCDRWPWLVGFVASYFAVYILNFTVFGKEPTALNFLIELLPVIGATALNVGFMLKDAADVRKCALISSPSWLIYNIANFAIGAIICEVLSLVSIVVGIFRHDRKNTEE